MGSVVVVRVSSSLEQDTVDEINSKTRSSFSIVLILDVTRYLKSTISLLRIFLSKLNEEDMRMILVYLLSEIRLISYFPSSNIF